MSDQTTTSEFGSYVATMVANLFPGGETGDGPADLDLHPGFWSELAAAKRPSERLRRSGYGLGFAKDQWRLRNRLAMRFRQRIPTMTFSERVELVRRHEAMVRALESERLLGSFHYRGDDPFPLDTVDLVADNLLAWLDREGFAVVPKERGEEEPLPPATGALPTVFDPATGTIRLRRPPEPGEEVVHPAVAILGKERFDVIQAMLATADRAAGKEEAAAPTATDGSSGDRSAGDVGNQGSDRTSTTDLAALTREDESDDDESFDEDEDDDEDEDERSAYERAEYWEDTTAWYPEGAAPDVPEWGRALLYYDPESGIVFDRTAHAQVWAHRCLGPPDEPIDNLSFNSGVEWWCRGLELTELLPGEDEPPLSAVGQYGHAGCVLWIWFAGMHDIASWAALRPYEPGGMEAFVKELEATGTVLFRPARVTSRDFDHFTSYFLYEDFDEFCRWSWGNYKNPRNCESDEPCYFEDYEEAAVAWGKDHAARVRATEEQRAARPANGASFGLEGEQHDPATSA